MDVLQNSTGKNNIWKGPADFIDQWALMSTPYPVLAIGAAYLLLVLKLGPEFMKNRKPFDLSKVILFYNVFLVFYSGYLVYLGVRLLTRYGILNSVCLTDNSSILYEVANGTYFYFIVKIIELLDTVFFVFRKKYNQVTFLHVYHHAVTMVATWVLSKYAPSYCCCFFGTVNSFVHVIMYGYYGLSTFPQLTPYLWWKKYITKLQLTQFVVVLTQLTAHYNFGACPETFTVFSFVAFQQILMIVLFSKFYLQTYSKNKKDKANKLKKEAERDKQEYVDSINNNDTKVRQRGQL